MTLQVHVTGHYVVCPSCGHKEPNFYRPACVECGSPWSKWEAEIWRERRALPWWRRVFAR